MSGRHRAETTPIPDRVGIETIHTAFGEAYNLGPLMRGVHVMAVCTHPRFGAGPVTTRLLLPHQLYLKDVPAGAEVAVAPVMLPWLHVTGEHAGRLSSGRPSPDSWASGLVSGR